jgi:Domain of unknown function (DUF1906)
MITGVGALGWIRQSVRRRLGLTARRAGRTPHRRTRQALLGVAVLCMSVVTPWARTSVAQANTIIDNYDGFDACSAPSVGQMYDFYYATPYYFANAYYAGATRSCSQPNLTATWVQQVENGAPNESMHYDVLPTYVGATAPTGSNGSGCDAGGSGEELTTSLSHDFSQGSSDGAAAARSLGTYGMTSYPPYLDVEFFETGWTDHGVGCGSIVDNYISGWIQGERSVAGPGPVGLYANPGPSPNVYTQYYSFSSGCTVNCPSAIWTADFGGANNVWGITGLPDSEWQLDQRISQWSRGTGSSKCSPSYYEYRNGACLNIDHDCAIALLGGPNNGEVQNEGTETYGPSGEDPHCNTYF